MQGFRFVAERCWGIGGCYSHDHLLAGKQWVANELARPEGDLVRHDGGVVSKYRKDGEVDDLLRRPWDSTLRGAAAAKEFGECVPRPMINRRQEFSTSLQQTIILWVV